jgi:two-component system, NarL family, response regulator NreC
MECAAHQEPCCRKWRVLLADDHDTVREGLMLLIIGQPDMEVVSHAADGRAAIEQARRLSPDVVIMDVSMPLVSGLEAIASIRQECPRAKILTLTRHVMDGYLQQMLRSGASGYVLKQTGAAEFLHGIRTVAAGGKYLDPAVCAQILGDRDSAVLEA